MYIYHTMFYGILFRNKWLNWIELNWIKYMAYYIRCTHHLGGEISYICPICDLRLSSKVTYGVLYMFLYMNWSYHDCSIKYSQLKIQWLWFDFPMLSNVRSYKINWKVRYDLLYLFHTTLTIILTFMRCH